MRFAIHSGDLYISSLSSAPIFRQPEQDCLY
jgi:hypothetical protein